MASRNLSSSFADSLNSFFKSSLSSADQAQLSEVFLDYLGDEETNEGKYNKYIHTDKFK